MLVMKFFITKTFDDRDYAMNDVSPPYVLSDEIRTFHDEKFRHYTFCLL